MFMPAMGGPISLGVFSYKMWAMFGDFHYDAYSFFALVNMVQVLYSWLCLLSKQPQTSIQYLCSLMSERGPNKRQVSNITFVQNE